MKTTSTLITLTLAGTLTLVGCSTGNNSASTNATNQTDNKTQTETSSADITTSVAKMLSVTDDLKKQIEAGDEAKIKETGPQLENIWKSFEDNVRSNYAMQYTTVEKYLGPLVAGSKASPMDKQTLTKLNDGLIQALNDLINATKQSNTSAKFDNPKLQAAADKYHEYVNQQSELFVQNTTLFVKAVVEGNVERSKQLYGPARVYYERIEPITESFGDLDPKIDAREDDDAAKSRWTGFHEIEKALWINNSAEGQASYANQLLSDAKALQEKIKSIQIKPVEVVAGAVELLNEASTTKITGEEERYSHLDLVDLSANVEGSEAAFHAIKPVLQEKDADLASEIEKRFQTLKDTLQSYRQGDSFKSYKDLKPEDTKKIAQAIDSVAEPLSQAAKILE